MHLEEAFEGLSAGFRVSVEDSRVYAGADLGLPRPALAIDPKPSLFSVQKWKISHVKQC